MFKMLYYSLYPEVQWGGKVGEQRSHAFLTFCFKMNLSCFKMAIFWMRSHTFLLLLNSCLYL